MRSVFYFTIGFCIQLILFYSAYAEEFNPYSPYNYDVSVYGDYICSENHYTTTTSKSYGSCVPGGSSVEFLDFPDHYAIQHKSGPPCEEEDRGTVTTNIYRFSKDPICVNTFDDGVQNGDEDGIDCGGSTGVDCVESCPDGYIPYGDNSCVATAENPYPAGTSYPNGEISDGEPWIKPGMQAERLQHSPDYTPTPDDWTESDYSTGVQIKNDDNTITFDKSGDYVIRDENGNIVEAQIIGESVSETDNGDGTTTVVTQDKIYKDGQTSTISTTTTVKDNATGEVISQYTAESSDSASFLGAGRGNTGALTGDQYSHGVESIVDAIKGEEDGEESSWSDPEYTESDIEYDPIDETQYDYESYIDNFISNNHDIGWLSVISDSGIQTSNPYCSISGDVSIGSTTVPLELSLCDYESTFQSMGAWLALLVQISALIITFGGLE